MIQKEAASELFSALSSTCRLKLLEILISSDRPLGVDELFDRIVGEPFSYQGRFHHLRILRRSELVRSHLINGKRLSLQANLPLLESLIEFLQNSIKTE